MLPVTTGNSGTFLSLPGNTEQNRSDRILDMDTVTPLPDNDLLRRMIAGDEEAFVLIYRRLNGAVYRFALHMSGSPEIAEEVTQETFLALIRSSRDYETTRGPLVAWLLGIARNLVRRAIGAIRETEGIEESSFAADVTGTCDAFNDLSRRETIEAVRQAVLSLPAAYREVVVLCELQEMEYRDAASILKCPIGTVRSRLHRARTMLMVKLRAGCLV